jgi:hypothetical protein
VLSAAAIVTASQFIPSKAQAQARLPVKQYRLVSIQQQASNNEEEKRLNSLGADGWSVHVAAGNVVILVK